MSFTLYGLKNCDTCRKAIKALEGQGHQVAFIDVRADGVEKEKLRIFLQHFGDKLVNTRSTTWRQLDAAERDAPALDLLSAHPTLMKRPVIVQRDKMTLGFDKKVQQELGL